MKRLRIEHLATVATVGVLASILLNATEGGARSLLRELLVSDLLSSPRRGLEAMLWCLLGIATARAATPRSAPTSSAILLLGAAAVVQVLGLTAELHGTGRGLAGDVWLLVPLLATMALFELSRVNPPERLLSVLLGLGLPAVLLSVLGGIIGLEGSFLGDSDRLSRSILVTQRTRGVFHYPVLLAAVSAFLVLLAGARLDHLMRSPTTHRGGHRTTLAITLGVAVIGLAGLIAADGLTAALALAAALSATALARWLRPAAWRPGLQWTVASATGIVVTAFPFVLGWLEIGSLTGRVHVWSRVLDTLTARERLVGLGADPMSRGTDLFDRLDTVWGALHAHSQSLDLFLEVGAIGLLAVAILAATLMMAGLRACGSSRGWSLGVAVYLVLLWTTDEIVTSRFFAYQFVTLGTLGLLFSWNGAHTREAVAETLSGQAVPG